MIIDKEDFLAHYGILRRSGRYPWGSGEDQPHDEVRSALLNHISELKAKGLSEKEIAEGMGISTTQFRNLRSIAKIEQRQADISQANKLKDKGMSVPAIAERMGMPERTVRSYLNATESESAKVLRNTTDSLRRNVDQYGMVDIGDGVENHIGISKTRMASAVEALTNEGYVVHKVQVETGFGTAKQTTTKVLAKPGTTYLDVKQNQDKIRLVDECTKDGGKTFTGPEYPMSISSSRVGIRYKEDGGEEADGVMYVRPGVPDVSLGRSRYAQVRVAVDNSHYIKGMAVYKDDLPPGIDILFNTNKSNTGNKLDALKKMTIDPDNPNNPFGSSKSSGAQIRDQIYTIDASGKRKLTSVMNIVNEEGAWGEWSRTISSQMLSKQSPKLAEQQLRVTREQKQKALEDIKGIKNPIVRRKFLEGYADEADSAATHLKAAAFAGQKTQVILPVKSMKPMEVYAPNFKNGETVVLVRFPHGGTFEIPELRVNNKNEEAIKLIGNGKDAVGIHHSVAERLSGADFDGDTVVCIPNPHGDIKSSPPLARLKNFDPKKEYKLPPGVPFTGNTQHLMGDISNLITDMTLQNAPTDKLALAVRHSMVVIDAEKHGLDHRRSAADHQIRNLKIEYQGSGRGGAATLISRKKRDTQVVKRRPRSYAEGGPIDPKTGKLMYTNIGKTYIDAKGREKVEYQKVNELHNLDDAHKMSSGTKMERVYADHSNRMKALANEARKEYINTPTPKQDPHARKEYAPERASLDAKLHEAVKNRPLERRAQMIANSVIQKKREANPDMTQADLQKERARAVAAARARTGADRTRIVITPREWEAIEKGAISSTRLEEILREADMDRVKALAIPRTPPTMTSARQARASSMLSNGYTRAEVSEALGISLSTLDNYMTEQGITHGATTQRPIRGLTVGGLNDGG